MNAHAAPRADGSVDPIDALRAGEYALIARLLASPPDAETLALVAALEGDDSDLGRDHAALAAAAATTSPAAEARAHFDLFVGVGRGDLLPYASFYLTGFLNERPLAALRRDLEAMGLERAPGRWDPEDHIAFLAEVMSGLADGRFAAGALDQAGFFARHLQPWAGRFFGDLAGSTRSRLYAALGRVGERFMALEAEAFAIGD